MVKVYFSGGAKEVGLTRSAKGQKLPGVTYYWARHTFATVARNTCRKSKDDVAMALNHVDEGRKTTDIYIYIDWRIVDEVQQAVVGVLFEHFKKSKEVDGEKAA